MKERILFLLILLIIAVFFGVIYWNFQTHMHSDEYVEAIVIGVTVVKTGSGFSSSSDSICIMETDEGKRINSSGTCFFVEGDKVRLHYHDEILQKKMELIK